MSPFSSHLEERIMQTFDTFGPPKAQLWECWNSLSFLSEERTKPKGIWHWVSPTPSSFQPAQPISAGGTQPVNSLGGPCITVKSQKGISSLTADLAAARATYCLTPRGTPQPPGQRRRVTGLEGHAGLPMVPGQVPSPQQGLQKGARGQGHLGHSHKEADSQGLYS